MMNWLKISAINLAMAVAFGAFGSHGLKNIANDYQLQIWQTATLYLFIHALGLLAIGVLHTVSHHRASLSAWLIQIGVLIFSGTLYLMALGLPKWLGAITPIGGTLMIIGWLALALTKSSSHQS
ncbi:DUF423 domain-containing protein [Moraxella sp.]|uniref:DUF423 domain-containing protein n=1 Tax=Moraxella sp. TaxID=479 RepID=UPI0026DCEC6D|nr:DUF423 domain-containing protein [Moraxella sp.]MDO4894028.1 DUF423 domain-containing protein [Moraxella sp.]